MQWKAGCKRPQQRGRYESLQKGTYDNYKWTSNIYIRSLQECTIRPIGRRIIKEYSEDPNIDHFLCIGVFITDIEVHSK